MIQRHLGRSLHPTHLTQHPYVYICSIQLTLRMTLTFEALLNRTPLKGCDIVATPLLPEQLFV